MIKVKNWIPIILFILFLAFFLLPVSKASGSNGVSAPLLWDVEHFAMMKKDTANSKTYHTTIREANEYCNQAPIVVTNKKKTYAPDNHYYCSVGVYWWPDPNNPDGPYINRDGEKNPEYYEYDSQVLIDFVDRCETFAKAFFFTEDDKYYDALVRQLNAWFVDKATCMYPNFEYAQVIKGQYDNKGTGKIEAYEFIDLLESIRLVSLIKPIDNNTLNSIQEWFLCLADWLDAKYGSTMRRIQNNVTLAYDVILTDMYLFAGEEDRAKGIADTFAERRIYTQITEEGKQPAELVRASSVTYSIFNLNHILDYCLLCKQWYPNYYHQNSERIDAAIYFLINAINNPNEYQYSQKSGFDHCRGSLESLIRRRNKLMDGQPPITF